ncbi:hypothetical protein Hanom_Chr11g01061531 [Helianthus anomalus]
MARSLYFPSSSSSLISDLRLRVFYKSMLDEYTVHISQMHPLGLAKLRHFEYACLSLGFLPEPLVFCALYSLV